jgi:hypothetical protein
MNPSLAAGQSIREAPRTAYDYVGGQVAALVERFGLHEARAQIMQTYATLCAEALAFPYGTPPPHHSRINHDGTPIQYAAAIGSPHRTLQFLSEAGSPNLEGAERLQVNRACLAAVAAQLGVSGALSVSTPLLDALAPATDVDLLADPGGAYWLGVAFSTARAPAFRIYVNARWGKVRNQWARLSEFATSFGASAAWEAIANRLAADLQPLGAAITLQGDQPPVGRIYLGTYGKHMPFYEALAEEYGGAEFSRQLRAFGRCLLEEDYLYPTQTATCSFGFGDGPTPNFKFELCAHCLFRSDAEAVARLRNWLEVAQLEAADYWDMLDLLSEDHLSEAAPILHCYVGLGLRRGAPYATVYLKPRLVPA